jgi:2-polyprenyl-3-methyl-5-hydroxy-6-metoxy-1,4-benzoquinol methylase
MNADPIPTRAEQEVFWDNWNRQYRTRGIDPFMSRQLSTALNWVKTINEPDTKVLDLGCGTGWLGGEISAGCGASVTGVDISEAAIQAARENYPAVEFMHGDVLTLELSRRFHAVVSADAIAHIPDQQRTVDFIASVLLPGGLFILMTQNPFVWCRSSYLSPKGQGQYRDWPGLLRLRKMLKRRFRVQHISSLVPGGDKGILRVVNSYYFSRLLGVAMSVQDIERLKERLLIGRELVVVSRRRESGAVV